LLSGAVNAIEMNSAASVKCDLTSVLETAHLVRSLTMSADALRR